jgi:hypothetical protein
MEIGAIASFVLLVVAWLAAPAATREAPPAVTSSLRIGEAKA